ncbi:hypothetical protein K469DRAFT_696982 [Zopfia rhizophila CBS 207.26]|uniref:Uncharacterized protein n=1 Tax=Zopfia rhizophila CBS 207.26 TaxID=1314779 RepID=A0A6A6EGV9_9PEZI|nr:hypothetical protein K469DRAFT_696982 [Zopfia rhizophila CBS 207.26]
MPAYTLSQTTAASLPKFNGCGGVLVGTDNEGNKIWACVVEKLYAHLFCNAPHRTWVIFVKVVDKRNTGGNLELQGVSAVDNIASWDANIIGGNSRERYNFALLAWIEREFPQIAAKYAPSSQDSPSNDNQDQDQVVLLYSKSSPSEPARKASPSEMAGKSIRCKGESARKRSALSQAQLSKVSKPVQRRRSPLDQKLSTTRHGVWPPEGYANDVGQVEEQEPPKVAVRRSERISRRTRDPAPPSPGLVRPKKSSQRLPDSTVRTPPSAHIP